MTYPTLKPLTHGQIIDRAVRLYRNNFWRFVGIAAVVFVPLQIISILISLGTVGSFADLMDITQDPNFGDSEVVGNFMSAYMAMAAGQGSLGFITVLATSLARAAIIAVGLGAYLGTKPDGIGGAYRSVFNSIGELIVTGIFVILLFIVLSLFAILVPFVGWFTGFGMLFTFSAVLTLIYPIVLGEKKSGDKALRRGWDLMRRRFWPFLGFIVLLSIFGQIVIVGPTAVATFLASYLAGFSPLSPDLEATANFANTFRLQTIISQLVNGLFQILYIPLVASISVILYYDLRVRSEGFDLELEAENRAEENRPIFDILQNDSPAPEKTKLLTGQDWGRFAGMSLGCIGLIALFYGTLFAIVFSISGLSGF